MEGVQYHNHSSFLLKSIEGQTEVKCFPIENTYSGTIDTLFMNLSSTMLSILLFKGL